MSWIKNTGKILIGISLIFALVQSGSLGTLLDIFQDIDSDDIDTTLYPTSTTVTPNAEKIEGYYERSYSWTYNGDKWTYSVSIPKSTYYYYKNLDHKSRDLAKYARDKSSRQYLSGLAEELIVEGQQSGYTKSEIVMNAVAFVQSLPYTSDSVTTGHDEYPRYPIETLVDMGGDCEDTAIFMSALLREMGYGAVIITLPGHAAVGVKGGDNVKGTYYNYNGAKYFYLETTGNGFKIGQIPEKYKSYKAKIIPV